jgi:hypothetical protein
VASDSLRKFAIEEGGFCKASIVQAILGSQPKKGVSH